MDVKNIGNETIEIKMTYGEHAKIVNALSSYAVMKDDELLSKYTYELMNPKVDGGK